MFTDNATSLRVAVSLQSLRLQEASLLPLPYSFQAFDACCILERNKSGRIHTYGKLFQADKTGFPIGVWACQRLLGMKGT